MQNNDQILEAIEHYLGQIGYPEEPGRLYAPISYSLTMTGKRLRPMLLMLTCGIFSDQPQAAMPAAAAVEVFHNFTLLHDDIMDNAAMRRATLPSSPNGDRTSPSYRATRCSSAPTAC